ncbi:LppA family lipoprotein, partial [Mycobacterium tuberculosis]
MIAPQPISRTLPRWQRIVALTMIGISTALIGGCTMDHNPDTSRRLTDEQKIQLIDSMRNKGSYEAARERLTATARIIADRVSAAIPGQTWKFTEDPAG